MVLTVTLNPAIDKMFIVRNFIMHKLHRLQKDETCLAMPGGKGVNISLNLKKLGTDSIATGFAGGHAGHMLCDGLRKEGITTNFIYSDNDTRTNISILDTENETLTQINDFGQYISENDIDFFLENYAKLLHRCDLVVLAGSVPAGVPDYMYGTMISMAHESSSKVILHTSPHLVDNTCSKGPFIINPDMRSRHELLGHHCDGIGQFIKAGKEILNSNATTEYIIFTHRIENIVVVTRQKSYILRPRDLKIVNMFGYGDAYLSGLIYGYLNNLPEKEMLLFASASGLANVENMEKAISPRATIDTAIQRIAVEEKP